MPTQKNAPEISIIIVSYNTKKYVLQTLQSIYATVNHPTFEVIVVENASNDGSYEAIRRAYPKVKLVQTEQLIGFSAANAFGVKHATGAYFFFLNPDTELQPNAVQELYSFLQRNKSYAVVSGQLLYPDGSIQPQGGSLPTLGNVSRWMLFLDDVFPFSLFSRYQQRSTRFFTKERQTGWVGGTALLISRKDYVDVGGWNTDIFLYGEDVELCYRIWKKGKKVGIVPSAKIIHHQHKSTGGSARSYSGEFEGLLYLWKHNFPAWQYGHLKRMLRIGAWLRVIVFGILLGDEHRKQTYLGILKSDFMA